MKGFAVAALLLTLPPVAAAASGDSGFYLSGRAGLSGAEWEVEQDDSFSTLPEDDTDVHIGATVGYSFTQRFGMEAGYLDLGDYSTDHSIRTLTFGAIRGRDSFAIKGWTLGVLATWPLTEIFDLYFKAGVYAYEHRRRFTRDGVSGGSTENDAEPYYGLGAKWNLTPTLDLGLELIEYEIDQASGSTQLSALLLYKL